MNEKKPRYHACELLRTVDVGRLATSVRQAQFQKYGVYNPSVDDPGDLLLHRVGWAMLARLGVPARVVVGTAAWRIAQGAHEVIIHNERQAQRRNWPKTFSYHSWLCVQDWLIDLSGQRLKSKLEWLDQQRNTTSRLVYAPSFIAIPLREVSTMSDVIQGVIGNWHYEPCHVLDKKLKPSKGPIDAPLVDCAHNIYNRPAAQK